MYNDPTSVSERLDHHLQKHPHLAETIYRELLITLHKRGIASIDAIQDRARARVGIGDDKILDDPNQAQGDRWSERERQEVERITREEIVTHFTVADIDDLVNLTLKRDEVHSLEKVAGVGNVTFRELADKVEKFCELPLGETRLSPEEVVGTRVALIRHFISDQLELIGVAKNHLQIRDFADITRRVVGSDEGMGRIGGKAGGMLLGHKIISSAEKDTDTFLPIAIPESYYLRSDVVEDFLHLNRLDQYQSQKYKDIDDVTREYPLIRGVFRNGDFPLKIVHSLRRVLEKLGTHPLIVRSSSLLEDRFGTGFYGKYASLFLPNQGTLEQRLRALLGGIAEVYASVLAPDPILYRREHNLIDYVEDMAVLIQKVVGFRVGDYFMPAFAGVAFSRNEHRWSPRIKREDGLMRLVMGLGTRAVDRGGADYPRMVAIAEPTLRPESTVQEILRGSQKNLDVIDLKKNRLRSVRLRDILASGVNFPMLDKIVSIYRDDELYPPTTSLIDPTQDHLCITFAKLLSETAVPDRIRTMLQRTEDAYGVPIDIEFASDGQKLYILQCRTQSYASDIEPVTVPTNIPDDRVVFDASRYVRMGLVVDIDYVVYIASRTYDAVPTRERRLEIARVIGRINRALERKSFILIGPGRWGSVDLRLGVPVRYADINRCHLLIEVSREKDGFMPEVSFGTHFFQDLVESGIHYLPLYPDIAPNRYNEHFLKNTPNALKSIVPADADFENEIRVIHVPSVADGRKLTITMDGEADKALGYLK